MYGIPKVDMNDNNNNFNEIFITKVNLKMIKTFHNTSIWVLLFIDLVAFMAVQITRNKYTKGTGNNFVSV